MHGELPAVTHRTIRRGRPQSDAYHRGSRPKDVNKICRKLKLRRNQRPRFPSEEPKIKIQHRLFLLANEGNAL